MDGKLMVFCDEIPGRHKILGKEYRVRDSRFLASDYMTMEDLNTDKIFVSWDSIIPEDREFIELCKHYAQFTESPKALAFRKGGVDFEEGDNIKTSLQEECYYDRYIKNLEYLSSVKQNGGVTGEGRIDWQSAFGKVPSGIGMRCKGKGIPAVAIVGGMGNGAEKIYDFGVESILPTINGAMDIEEALERAEELYKAAADRMFRFIKVGMGMAE